MAWGRGKEVELLVEVAVLKKELEMLRQLLDQKNLHINTLQASLDRAYEAITAKEAPEAYRDRKVSEPTAPLTPEQERMRKLADKNYELLREIEDPSLFKSAEDMVSQLQRVLGGPKTYSLHGDDES